MFLNRERPETDDFAIKKYLVVKKKFVGEILIFHNTENVFAYSCVSEHSEHF